MYNSQGLQQSTFTAVNIYSSQRLQQSTFTAIDIYNSQHEYHKRHICHALLP